MIFINSCTSNLLLAGGENTEYACIQQQGELRGEGNKSAESPTYGNTISVAAE